MAYTAQQILDLARLPLNDAAKVRYPDVELLAYLNTVLMLFRKRRPDLFLGRYAALPGPLLVTDTWPTADEYASAAADFVTGRAELKDAEEADTGRVAGFMGLFEKGLIAL
jgi:hypothetical protein